MKGGTIFRIDVYMPTAKLKVLSQCQKVEKNTKNQDATVAALLYI
jgi:hypothetical protein